MSVVMKRPGDVYGAVTQTSVTPAFLRSNATSHSSPFGAIAELIDNSVDSGATWCALILHGNFTRGAHPHVAASREGLRFLLRVFK